MASEVKDGVYIEEKKVMKEKSKIGHRRISDQGTVTYKKKTTSEIQKAIQLGIRISVTLAHNQMKRDMLLKDFGVVETRSFPRSGGKDTPPHDLSDFTFKTFAPIAFRYFRDFFQVDITDYLNSICHQELRELSNAGASGSIFYITCDDEFIIKTVQHKEASFLQKLLPEYYINLIQHPRTLLPKFYGLYCYQTMGKNIRFVIMNNLVPSIKIHEKYDLKGSTYKRIANAVEKSKSSPTLKDIDFRENHVDGLYLEVDTFEALLNTIQRDCRVLESFSIMDYSLLLGIHNVDESLRAKKRAAPVGDIVNHSLSDNHAVKSVSMHEAENDHRQTDQLDSVSVNLKNDKSPNEENINMSKPTKELPGTVITPMKKIHEQSENSGSASSDIYYTPINADNNNQNNSTVAKVISAKVTSSENQSTAKSPFNRQRSRSRSTRRIAAYSTVLESIQAPVEEVELENVDEEYIPTGGIPARNKVGDRLILFMGLIDILQSYQILKKMEHNMKAIFLDAKTISVTNPTFYAQRFQDFFGNVVFTKIPSPMRHHPDRKRSSSIRKDISEKDTPTCSREVYDKSNTVVKTELLDTFDGANRQTSSPNETGKKEAVDRISLIQNPDQ